MCFRLSKFFACRSVGVFVSIILFALASAAQSPNTGSIVVSVVDQNEAVVQGANITLVNAATGAERDAVSNSEGSATFAALSLTGAYKVSVNKSGFTANEAGGLQLRSGETAEVKIKLAVSGTSSEVTVIGTAEGVRSDPQIGVSFEGKTLDKTPILGRKLTAVPLFNSAFRQGKGTGDLFVNQVYFITGVGSRRATTFTLDGATNDEGWGRQTAITTIPIGAVQEVAVLTNAFSSEFGWTSGPAFNVVTKSGTNDHHGEGIFLYRPGGWQARTFSTDNYCPGSVSSCVTPTSLTAINPVDIPDQLSQVSGSIGGPIVKDKTFYFLSVDHTRQNRTTYLSSTLPSYLLPPDGHLDYTGHYRQTLFDGRVDHRLTSNQNLMFRFNMDRMTDDNPQDAVSGTNAPSVARRYSRRSWAAQVNHTTVINHDLLNEARFAYLHGDPVTLWEAQNPSTVYTRSGAAPFTIGESRSSNLRSNQFQFSDTVSWTLGKHLLKIGGSIARHNSGGTGSEPGQAVLGTFTFLNSGPRATVPFPDLLITDVQNYSQPINFGIDSYDLNQWLLVGFIQDSFRVSHDLTLDLGLRYDRQTLTDAKKNFAPRLGFGWHPGGHANTVIRGGYGMYYTQLRTNSVAGYLVNGLDGLATYTANPGQTGFPTCLTCVPVNVDPHVIPAAQLPQRNITIRAGRRAFYEEQFQRYGLNFDLLPFYPDALVNPRSQVLSFGVQHEFARGFVLGSDYVHQHLSNIDRSVDLNAPSPFDRTAVGQLRTTAAANATRPILPVNGGVRSINALMNFGVADYNGWQTRLTYSGNRKMFASFDYTLSKATNTTEPDGNGIAPNQPIISRLGEEERGPSVVDQRHRFVAMFWYQLPWNFTAGTVGQFASARPFNATTGVDNNGDFATNDRPVIDGRVIPKSFFRGSPTSEVSIFVENRISLSERAKLLLRVEGFNIFNHANMLGRGQTIYSTVVGGLDTATPRPDFGVLSTSFTDANRTNAIPAFANIDPPRMFQLQARIIF